MNIESVFGTIEKEFDKYVDFLCDICAFEARATDKETLDKMADFITEFAEKEGFSAHRTKFEKAGDFLCIDINKGNEKGCTFMAHTDTVHDKGTFGNPAVKRDGNRIIAPGVIDCKGGISIALLVMKAMLVNGYSKHLRLILTTDEEISNSLGGEKEIQYFKDMTEGFPYAINCETSKNDEVAISRSGIRKYMVEVKGIGGHAGMHYFDCANPVLEAANKIIALESKSEKGGITYSCNVINGGTVFNKIPDTCSFSIDIRFKRMCDSETVEKTVREIVDHSYVEGTSATVRLLSQRPPMEKTEATVELFNKFLETANKYGLGTLIPVESGGGSDSCYTQMAGVTSICGMGACGEFCHTDREYANTDSLLKRSKLLAGFLI